MPDTFFTEGGGPVRVKYSEEAALPDPPFPVPVHVFGLLKARFSWSHYPPSLLHGMLNLYFQKKTDEFRLLIQAVRLMRIRIMEKLY